MVSWYYRHREGSRLQADDWEAFADPRRTTYRGYNELQDRKEDVIDGLLREIDDTGYDDVLSEDWVAFLDRWYAPLRFPAHGLQMLAAYVAQLAPASRITNCAAFQSADEMRRLQRIAYRTVQLSAHRPEVEPSSHRQTWEDAAEFQPLRELIERALVTYDWGESFVVTNAVIKPHVDRLVNEEIAGTLAAANGDPILQSIHFSLDEDARWHREWSAALVRVAITDTPANADIIAEWIDELAPVRPPGGRRAHRRPRPSPRHRRPYGREGQDRRRRRSRTGVVASGEPVVIAPVKSEATALRPRSGGRGRGRVRSLMPVPDAPQDGGASRSPALSYRDGGCRSPIGRRRGWRRRTLPRSGVAVERLGRSALRNHDGQIELPVLAMHGTADLMADPDDTGELVALAVSHDKSLELVPDGFHALLRDLGHEATLAHNCRLDRRANRAARSETGSAGGRVASERWAPPRSARSPRSSA